MAKKILILLLMAFWLVSCATVHKKISEESIPDYHTKIYNNQTTYYSSTWVQPINKSEKCEFLMEGYSSEPNQKDTNKYKWDGHCENGKAQGVGKVTATGGGIDTFEITYQNKGVTDTFYYRSVVGTSKIEFGAYVHENGKMAKTLQNHATLDKNNEIEFTYASVVNDMKTQINQGVFIKKYNDGTARHTGLFGNNIFFGMRENLDTQSKPTSTFWGYINLTTDKPESYGAVRDKQRLIHVLWDKGSFVELVELPKSYTSSVNVVTEEALEAAHKARNAGQLALAMKNKYDNLHSHSNTNRKKETIQKEPSHSISTGTGFFISNDGYLLTNSHVVEGSTKFSIIFKGKKTTASLISQDQYNDIALLRCDVTSNGLPIEFKSKTMQGEEISVVGYPNIGLQGNEQKATFGYINANSGIKGDVRYFQISAPIQPGNSGSPLLNSSGVVVGVVTATLNQSAAIEATGTLAQNVNYAIKIAYALPLLIGNNVNYESPDRSKVIEKTNLIKGVSKSIVLVIAE